ncbi:MAG: GDSL-type esterase/lipase family protein [Lachnospiraceae bacterium]|nr:GDSL-type esterase/lipase family protein [Lachnospiraceae bacterium]
MQKRRQQQIRAAMIIVAALLFVIVMVEWIGSVTGRRADITEGLALIMQVESADINAIESRIQRLEEQDRQMGNGAENGDISLKEFFDGNVVLGDSIAEGLLAYDVLNPSSVVATTGARLSDIGNQLRQLQELNPRIIYLALGMNDLSGGMLTNDQILASYAEVIDKVRTALPETVIIVNAIFPVRADVLAEQAVFERIPALNEGLQDLAYRRQIAFLDNSHMVRADLYEEDGIHFVPAFYQQWAESMREVAER